MSPYIEGINAVAHLTLEGAYRDMLERGEFPTAVGVITGADTDETLYADFSDVLKGARQSPAPTDERQQAEAAFNDLWPDVCELLNGDPDGAHDMSEHDEARLASVGDTLSVILETRGLAYRAAKASLDCVVQVNVHVDEQSFPHFTFETFLPWPEAHTARDEINRQRRGL